MSVQKARMKLTDVDEEIIAELRDGRCTQGYLVDSIKDAKRYKIHDRLKMLKAAGHITCVHRPTALHELIDDPMED